MGFYSSRLAATLSPPRCRGRGALATAPTMRWRSRWSMPVRQPGVQRTDHEPIHYGSSPGSHCLVGCSARWAQLARREAALKRLWGGAGRRGGGQRTEGLARSRGARMMWYGVLLLGGMLVCIGCARPGLNAEQEASTGGQMVTERAVLPFFDAKPFDQEVSTVMSTEVSTLTVPLLVPTTL